MFVFVNKLFCRQPVRCVNRFYSSQTNMKSTLKLTFIGASFGALIGTGYSLHKLNRTSTHSVSEEIKIEPLKALPDVTASRKLLVPNDSSGLKVTLYQYQTCPFCCKVRAFLEYYGISHDIVEVDPVLRQSIKWSPYKKVPILLAKVPDGYQQLNDSSMIISSLASVLNDRSKQLGSIVGYYPIMKLTDPDGNTKTEILNKYFLMLEEDAKNEPLSVQLTEERKWRKWADDVLVHMLSPNVYRTFGESLQAFNWFSEVGEWETNFPLWERLLIIYVGAAAMWMIGKRLKKRHHLKDDVRQSLYDECNNWMRAINKKGTTFMGGSYPDLSDLAVYGILSSIEGCDAFKELLENCTISLWYNSMKQMVKNHEGMRFLS